MFKSLGWNLDGAIVTNERMVVGITKKKTKIKWRKQSTYHFRKFGEGKKKTRFDLNFIFFPSPIYLLIFYFEFNGSKEYCPQIWPNINLVQEGTVLKL